MSITSLNGLRAVEDGVRNEGGPSNVTVNKGILVSVKSSLKEKLDGRESKAFEILQSACAFLEEGYERMAKGVANKNMNEIEATQKIIELAQEKQRKQSMNWKQCIKRNKG